MRNGKTGLEVLEKPSPLDAEVALVQSDRKSDLERADVVPVLPRNRAGFAVALHLLDIELRYNERAGKPEFRHGDEEWSEFTERKESVLFEEIAARFNATTSRGDAPLRFKGQDRTDAVNSLLDDECIDPFEEWIQALPKVGRRESSFLFAQRPIRSRQKSTGRNGPAATPFSEPSGARFDQGRNSTKCRSLIGPQGIGKSTVLDLAFPPDTEWFTDDLDLSAYRKERAETLQGRVIVEVSEMAGATRAELRSLKGFLSRRKRWWRSTGLQTQPRKHATTLRHYRNDQRHRTAAQRSIRQSKIRTHRPRERKPEKRSAPTWRSIGNNCGPRR